MKSKTHYEILEISRGADQSEIKSAYRRLTAIWHPDKHFGDLVIEEKFKGIVMAYNVLSDPDKRMAYDLGFGTNGLFDSTKISSELLDPEQFIKTVQDLFGKFLDGKVSKRFERREDKPEKQKVKVCKACQGKGVVRLQQGRVTVRVPCGGCSVARVG
jgi:DnaJ-class molecular chaperone